MKKAISQYSLKFVASLALLALCASAAHANDDFLPVDQAYKALLEVNEQGISVSWSIEPGYYLYRHQFGLAARDADNALFLPMDIAKGKLKYDDYYEKDLEVYYFNTLIQAPVPQLSPPYEIVLKSQGCADAGLCYPPRTQYFSVDGGGNVSESEYPLHENVEVDFSVLTEDSLDAQIDDSKTQSEGAAKVATSPTAASSMNFALAFVFAFIGGIILNLLPCVFPVLSLKALSIASHPESLGQQRKHGWAYTAGAVVAFLLAGGILLAVRELGGIAGWGFQLQQPIFVALMIYLFFLMGLSLSGFFTFGARLMGAGESLTHGSGLSASFFTGVLAALVASPCTGPLMAPALGYALTQPSTIALTIFAALGLGMAFPFLLLSYVPALANYLPAPGLWMEKLKQFLAFPLYLTCVWLLWVLGHQASSDGAAVIVLGATLLAFAIWLGKSSASSKTGGLAIRFASIAVFASAIWMATTVNSYSPGPSKEWVSYSPDRLEAMRDLGRPVLIDLTADWCITCKVNKKIALSSEDFFQKAEANQIVLMQGDWTNADPDITALLESFERSGVPLYLMYPKGGGQPEILPQLLTKGIVLEAMDRAVQ